VNQSWDYPNFSTEFADRADNNVIIIKGAKQVGKSHFVNSVQKSIDRPCLAYDLGKNPKIRREISKTEDLCDFSALMTD